MSEKIQWLGHASFRIQTIFEDRNYVIYIDPWLTNPFVPKELDATDADLILITHGHWDHQESAPQLVETSTKPNCKILSNGEIKTFLQNVKQVPMEKCHGMNKSGTLEQGFCKVTMVNADHSSSCGMHNGFLQDGGNAAGFVVRFPSGVSVYHSGDTGIFSDMALIDELYQPSHLLVSIGGNFTMGPEEAAYACNKMFKHARLVIPMHFGTFPLLPGTFSDFKKAIDRQDLQVVDSYADALGKWIDLK